MFTHGYALLIGVDQNKVPSLALPVVKKDVTKVRDVITHPDRCAYPEANVQVLTGPDATRERILDGLDWLKIRLAADDSENQTVFIYYSGHGHREASGEAFLIPYDARSPLRLGGLAAQDFAESIDGIRPRRLLVVLDCCHAEGLNIKDGARSGLGAAAVTPATPGIALLADGEGRAVLSSSRGVQKSWIRNDGRMSVFTYHLVEALTGHAGRPAWPDVTVTEVMEYVGRTVTASTRSQHNAEQEPVFRYSGTAFPIALVLGGKGVEKGAAAPDPFEELPLNVHSNLTVDRVEGKAGNVDIQEMESGQLEANADVRQVAPGGEFVNTRIGKLGLRPHGKV